MTTRSAGYTISEDVLLCEVYLDISQDPITGRNQSSTEFWSRVEETYNERRLEHWECRSNRSVHSRMDTISAEVKKLNGCLRQVEYMNPSGASEEDILHRAKVLFMQEPKYKKGFKFDHVWNMVKNFEKFKDIVPTARQAARSQSQNVNFDSSQSNNLTPESPISTSPGLSSFSPNLDDDGFGATSSQRPAGVKKSKSKRKNDEQMSSAMNIFKEENRQLMELLKKTSLDREKAMNIQQQNLAFKEKREENKILLKDLNSIDDPIVREYFRAEQAKIIQKRTQQQQGSSSATNAFGQYFDDFGGSGSGLPEY